MTQKDGWIKYNGWFPNITEKHDVKVKIKDVEYILCAGPETMESLTAYIRSKEGASITAPSFVFNIDEIIAYRLAEGK